MYYKIIVSENFKSVRWSGGHTTELFIFPATADYQKRNFQFRLSTSTVETDKSDFSLLNGISRKLMVLSGHITLNHENHYSRELSEFEIDEFEGNWKTTSDGKCTDFNLMTTVELQSSLNALILEKDQNVSYNINVTFNWLFIYNFSGEVSLKISAESIRIQTGDLLILREVGGQIVEIKGIEHSALVISMISS